MRPVLLLLSLWVASWMSAPSTGSSAAPPRDAAERRAAARPPPLPPLAPVDSFRKLLNMPPAEREKLLAEKTPPQRRVIELKLREYQAMSPDQREAHLRALRTRLLMRQFIRLPISNRVDRLADLPEADRVLLEPRLQQWEKLSSELKSVGLENDWAMYVFIESDNALSSRGARSPEQRAIEQEVARWKALPLEQQQKILQQFREFFDEFDARARAETLANALTETERQQIQGTLQTLASMPKEQRDRCLAGFQKFAELTTAQRQQFLVNVELWTMLTPKERDAWRTLVSRASTPPPLPPTGVPARGTNR